MSIKDSYLGQAWLVLALAVCFGAALAGVELALRERIDDNKLQETLRRVPQLVPGGRTGEAVDVAGYEVYLVRDAGNGHVGWVVKAGGQGFADYIELLIGLDRTAERITGLWVLDQKETPNLGNKIEEEPFRRPFSSGKLSAGAEITVSREPPVGPNQVKPVTGATVSSESVCKIINAALADLRADLARLAEQVAAKSRPATKDKEPEKP